MSKFQFYSKPDTNDKAFTFLDMGTNSFLDEKEILFKQGFEVSGDVIFAATPKEAVEKYRSNFLYVSEEYTYSNLITAIPLLLINCFRWAFGRRSKH